MKTRSLPLRATPIGSLDAVIYRFALAKPDPLHHAQALGEVAWYALFVGEFTKALAFADRAQALVPDDLEIEIDRAHAPMFLGHKEESKALYLVHKGEPVSGQDGKLWERVIVDDFVELREPGLSHPMMADIERESGVSQ